MRFRALSGGVLAAVLAFAGSQDVWGSELREAALQVQPAVVHVRVTFRARVAYATVAGATVYGPYELHSRGSGVLVHGEGLVLTQAHVIEPPADLLERFQQVFLKQYVAGIEAESGREFSEAEVARLVGQILAQGSLRLLGEDGKPVDASSDLTRDVEVIRRQAEAAGGAGAALQAGTKAEVVESWAVDAGDLALLSIGGSNLPTAQLADADPRPDQQTLIIGYVLLSPRALDLGEPAEEAELRLELGEGKILESRISPDETRIFTADVAVDAGATGGPAIDAAGRVIGLYSASAAGEGALGLEFVRPVSDLRRLLAAAGMEVEPGASGLLFERALSSYRGGRNLQARGLEKDARKEFEQAAEDFAQLLALDPGHPDAGDLLGRCQTALQSLPKGLEIPTLAVGVAGLALLALAAILVLRRRPAEDTPEEQRSRFLETRAWKLVAESGPLAGQSFEIGAEGLVIGRDPARCQMVYQGETISRQHARVAPGPGGLLLTNLSKTNRTYLNDQPIEQTGVRPGDRIRIGQAVLRVEG